jgi:polar amino acid transport system substrate-binding protein
MKNSLHPLLNALTIVLVLSIVSMVGVASAGSDVLSNIKSAGILKVAVPQDFPPFGSVGPDMQPIGYDIDMANLIAKKLGVKLKLVPVTSTNKIPYLTTGKVDLVISSLGKNPKRAAVIDFLTAYAPFFNGGFGPSCRKETPCR